VSKTRTIQRLGLVLFIVLAVFTTTACAAASRVIGEAKPSTNAVGPAGPMDSLSKGDAPAQSGGGSAGSTGSSGSTTTLPSADSSRLMIRTGSMDLVVRSVPDAVQGVRDATSALNGFVSDSSLTGNGNQRSAQLTLRVPSDRLDDAIARLKGLAVEVRTASTSSRDVTEEVTDIEASLRNLRSVEAQYAQLLGRATNVNDVLQVQQRLDQTRLQIDRTEARRKVLASQTDFATLSVSLRSVAVAGTGRLAAIEHAWVASLQTLDRVFTGTIVTVVFFWWAIPLALIGLWIGLRDARRRRAAKATPPSAA
jgi:hypothetical protein